MLNNYEEYMRSVLGYKTEDTYRQNEDYYYNMEQTNKNIPDTSRLYPEIYGIVYPLVQKVCSRRNFGSITEESLNDMVNEIYNVIESEEEIIEARSSQKGVDVKNTRQKEQVKEPRRPKQNNYLLRDLIKILILRELLSGGGPVFIPGMPGPGGPRNAWRTRKTTYATSTVWRNGTKTADYETSETQECFKKYVNTGDFLHSPVFSKLAVFAIFRCFF